LATSRRRHSEVFPAGSGVSLSWKEPYFYLALEYYIGAISFDISD